MKPGKEILFYLLLIVLPGISQAQKKGNTLMGGNLNLVRSSAASDFIQDGKHTYFSVVPVVGTMVSDQVAIGVGVGYTHINNVGDKQTLMSIAPFVRIHRDITEDFKFFVEPAIAKVFELGDESDHKTQIFSLGVGLGLLYFVSPSLSLELNVAGVNYLHMSDKDFNRKENSVTLQYDLVAPNIGLKYYF